MTWIVDKQYQNLAMGEIYVISLYYMVTTISTVGYGDIHSTNLVERMICIVLMIGGVFFFSFSSGSLTTLITQKETKQHRL